MQRFSAASYGGINNNASGGSASRENARADSSFSMSNFPVNSRRQLQLAPFRVKCDKEPINCRLGPPDFFPQTPNCLEETLTREYLQSGYKETVEGIEEAREITLSQGLSFSKPEYILKCKEALGKRLRAINESRAQKRKAGQVYGVALSGHLLAKPSVFPEQRSCSEESRRKWIEALSQQHKRLQSLAEHVPHGYRRKSLFEVLIRFNVPLLRASWFVKVTYLNQIRPGSCIDVSRYSRSELWTKDVTEYLQQLLDEYFPKDGSTVPASNTDQLSPGFVSLHNSTNFDAEEPSLQFKWWYMLRLVQWHYAEGLIVPSIFIDWVFTQLQEKDSALALELLFPVLCDVIDSLALSQTYVRMFVELTVKSINELSSSCSDSADSCSKKTFISALTEAIRYLIVAVPDTFVALDCFPLPTCVVPDIQSANVSLKSPSGITVDHFETRDAYLQYLSAGHIVSSIQKRSSDLAKVVNSSQAYGAAKVVQALDKALMMGDVRSAYNSLFEDASDIAIEERWIAEVSPGLKSSLKWIRTASPSLICAVFFLCEWATCNYRDCRSVPQNSKLSGRKDISQIYFAVLILRLKMEDMLSSTESKEGSSRLLALIRKNGSVNENLFCGPFLRSFCSRSKRAIFESPGPLHDMIVCWLDQHELGRTESSLNVEVFLVELIRNGIFYPQAYVRQLIVSGVMDKSNNLVDFEKWSRHHRVLKLLPGSCLLDVLEETRFVDLRSLRENFFVYSNERHLMLREHVGNRSNNSVNKGDIGSNKNGKLKNQISRLRILIARCLHLPIMPDEIASDEYQGGFKRASGSLESKGDFAEGTIGCEECRRAKRQKLVEGKNSTFSLFSSNSDDEDIWWVRKGSTQQESSKVEIPPKSVKPSSRGRQKTVRKTQSLAHLAATRIESNQGASTSHVCENKISCPHHKSALEAEVPKQVSNVLPTNISDIGKSLKQLRLAERRSISFWLLRLVKKLIEGNKRDPSKASNCTDVFSVPSDANNSAQWRLGEDELLSILYVLDISCDLVSALKFLVWLVPKILSGANNGVQSSRSQMLPKNRDNQIILISDSFFISSLQRYENVLVASDLLPELLTAVIQRSVTAATSSGRPSSSSIVAYARSLFRKYKSVANVSKWEKNFRATSDQRMLAELDGGRNTDGDSFFSFSVSTGVEEPDEHIRQKISVKMSRCLVSMKELVQKHMEDAARHFLAKKSSITDVSRSQSLEKWDNTYLIAQDIVVGLVDLIRQYGGATPDIEPSMVASAVSSVLSSPGPTLAKLLEFTANSNHQNVAYQVNYHYCIKHILQVHIYALCLLKDAVGDRSARTFEIAVANEASSIVSVAFAPGKLHRGQFQPSPDAQDMYSNHSNEFPNSSAKVILGKSAKTAAFVTAVVIGAIVHGVSSLDRMVTAFRLKEGLDVMQLIRGARSTSNGISRSYSATKLDYSMEVYVHWFRVLIGNCRTVYDGLVADFLGESYVLALHRLQQMLPLNLVFPPAYAIFAMVVWRPYISNTNAAIREDIQSFNYLSTAIVDATKHKPFRDLFFRNMQGFYDLLNADSGDSEFARMLELHSPDKQLKTMAFAPLRARLFLDALIDCGMPSFPLLSEDGSWVPGRIDPRAHAETEAKLLDQVVYILDTLQPAKFHWQWVELRLLLNEQAFIEKIDTLNMSLVDAIKSLSPSAENYTLTESEKKVIEIILTRLLVRPDAALLYAEVVHLLGKSLQESFVMDTKWILAGPDVLLGRKSIRQQLLFIAQRKGLPTKELIWKPWGWSSSRSNAEGNKGDKRKLEVNAIEEGEVVDETIDIKRSGKSIQSSDFETYTYIQNYATENALTELILPCIDRSSSELRNLFATELIKQLGTIEQQVNVIAHTGGRSGVVPSGVEGSSSKGNNRKGMRGGSPVLGRRPTGNTDSAPPSALAVKASIWLRLQFLLRLLPIVFVDRDLKNMRQLLASCILRLLGTRVVYEEADILFPTTVGLVRREVDPPANTALVNYPSDTLFDRLLSVLYGLVSNCKPSWLKPKSASKSTVKSPRDCSVFDREAVEVLQADLDRMELPAMIRRRIQAAMPVLVPLPSISVTCHPPTVSPLAVAPLQPLVPSSGPHPKLFPSGRVGNSLPSKNKNLPSQDLDMEIDPWTILEDGTGSASASASSNGNNLGNIGSDHSYLKAASWLKGAVRVRRTDLTYIGALDDDI